MKDYEVFMGGDVYSVLETLPKRERSRLKAVIFALGRFPEMMSDQEMQDRIGRIIDIHFFERWAIHYWIDHADQHIKVTALQLRKR